MYYTVENDNGFKALVDEHTMEVFLLITNEQHDTLIGEDFPQELILNYKGSYYINLDSSLCDDATCAHCPESHEALHDIKDAILKSLEN